MKFIGCVHDARTKEELATGRGQDGIIVNEIKTNLFTTFFTTKKKTVVIN